MNQEFWDSLGAWLTDESIATYIVGIIATVSAITAVRRQSRLNKKSAVFEELSKDIQEAVKAVNAIDTETNQIIKTLADEADENSRFDPRGLEEEELKAAIDAEDKRRLIAAERIGTQFGKQINSIYEAYGSILGIIEKVERGTVVNDNTKAVARYLYFFATEQHNLVRQANDVLVSFNVVPVIGQSVNITPETFKAFADLYTLINEGNVKIRNFLYDLEVAIHNDLVKKTYKKAAKYSNFPNEHITPKGMIDKRINDSLV